MSGTSSSLAKTILDRQVHQIPKSNYGRGLVESIIRRKADALVGLAVRVGRLLIEE
jgi:hypothetical protein